jgi:hypothetical protein
MNTTRGNNSVSRGQIPSRVSTTSQGNAKENRRTSTEIELNQRGVKGRKASDNEMDKYVMEKRTSSRIQDQTVSVPKVKKVNS